MAGKPKKQKAVDTPSGSICEVKQIESTNPKKRERDELDTVVAFTVNGREFHGIAENLQTEQGVRMFLMTVADEMEMEGQENTSQTVREAFFAQDLSFIPTEVVEAVRGN